MFNFEQPDKLGLNFDLGSSRLYVQQHRPIIVIGAGLLLSLAPFCGIN